MPFSINTNIASLQAQNYLATSSSFQAHTINEVTSGLRIVNSGDDAAGLAVANGLASSQAILSQGIQNANNGLSTLQTIDGGMNNINTLLDRAQTLATESASGTFSGNRSTLNSEFQSVLSEINRQAQSIGLNTGGQFAKSLSVYIGGGQGTSATAQTQNGTINVDLSASAVDSTSLGLQNTQAVGAFTGTTVQSILADTTNQSSQVVPGQTQFSFQGAGFAGASAIKVAVNLTGVSNLNTLVSAVNAAIQSSGAGGTTASTAFRNANIVASVHTDVNGNQELAFSSSTAFQAQALDGTANALMGNFNVQGQSSASYSQPTINTTTHHSFAITWNGAANATTYTLSSANTGAGTSIKAIAADLNSQATFSQYGKAYVDSGNHLIIQSNQTGVGSQVAIANGAGTLANDLGITNGSAISDTAAGQSVAGTVTGAGNSLAASTAAGAGAGNIIVRIQGSGLASPVDIKLTVSSTTTGAQINTALTTAVNNNAQLQAAGIKTGTTFAAGGPLSFTNSSNQTFSVQVAGDNNNVLGFGTWALANPTTATSLDYTSITAGAATAAGAATLDISAGGGQNFQIAATMDGTIADDVAATNAAIAQSAQATAAGLVASSSGGKLQLTSNNGTNFRVNETDGNAYAGFSSNAASALAQTYSSATSPEANNFVSGGAQATQSVSFTPIQYGGDAQTVNISSADANGVVHTANVVLKNNSTLNNAGTVGAAVNAINAQLQNSNDPTLQGIVAVQQNVNGQDTIGFLSTKTFQVTTGTVGSGAGLGSQGTVQTSALSAGGAAADISTAVGAQNAINALTNAIAYFGTAQAAVGRGENNLNYAVSLAQSQLTNSAAAESTIKDANLAQQAANLTKAQILVQAGTAALAQANSAPQQLLTLLQH